MGGITGHTKQMLMDHIHGITPMKFSDRQYLSLHSADPGDSGSSELSSYELFRVPIKFTKLHGAMTNAEKIRIDGLPQSSVSHFGVWDSVAGGNLLWHGKLDSTKYAASGDSLEIPAGTITHSF